MSGGRHSSLSSMPSYIFGGYQGLLPCKNETYNIISDLIESHSSNDSYEIPCCLAKFLVD